MIKFYREEYCGDFDNDAIADKFMELQDKYKNITEREQAKGKDGKPIKLVKPDLP
eukprot:CAMPEP_0116879802 /NCGR_PEP_ID=MMETSP0463-20121206/11640_1 /TAXON_ID=181622 /ORGANISM="Strombidinopsis sp, Strain SopsisLIS2011" /LENGTH=54 /DNA_ID=CAMNT_0004529563 /DNA_START=387 /DNA_END=551 /DNA_ORIENTATION=+